MPGFDQLFFSGLHEGLIPVGLPILSRRGAETERLILCNGISVIVNFIRTYVLQAELINLVKVKSFSYRYKYLEQVYYGQLRDWHRYKYPVQMY